MYAGILDSPFSSIACSSQADCDRILKIDLGTKENQQPRLNNVSEECNLVMLCTCIIETKKLVLSLILVFSMSPVTWNQMLTVVVKTSSILNWKA